MLHFNVFNFWIYQIFLIFITYILKILVKAVLCVLATSCRCWSLMDDGSTSRLWMTANSRALFSDFEGKMSHFLSCFSLSWLLPKSRCIYGFTWVWNTNSRWEKTAWDMHIRAKSFSAASRHLRQHLPPSTARITSRLAPSTCSIFQDLFWVTRLMENCHLLCHRCPAQGSWVPLESTTILISLHFIIATLNSAGLSWSLRTLAAISPCQRPLKTATDIFRKTW